MSITMAYGMEVYNVALKEGGLAVMTNRVFPEAPGGGGLHVAVRISVLQPLGQPAGHRLAARLCRPQDNPFLHTVLISSCTVLIMCPTMSMVAAILFSVILGGRQLEPATQLLGGHGAEKTSPWPLLWNLFAAGPCLPAAVPAHLRPAAGRLLNAFPRRCCSSAHSKAPAH